LLFAAVLHVADSAAAAAATTGHHQDYQCSVSKTR